MLDTLTGPTERLSNISVAMPYAPAMPGTVIAGRYVLREPLGHGGMGEVWASDQREPVRRRVALKLVRAGLETPHALARFEIERQALALMDHPGIATVFDAGVDDGRPYFVMELLQGRSLTGTCDERRLCVRERLALFVQVCLAVQHAHQKGIIHRDLKPSNILVVEEDGKLRPKVIDFGVAKVIGLRLTEGHRETDDGTLLGTLEYMAPEQAGKIGLDVDTRADIYALGVILYELLTGAVPFDRQEHRAAGVGELLRKIREDEPTKPSTKISSSARRSGVAAVRAVEPGRLIGQVRGELDWIALKCLEKDPERRYESAAALARDVERFLADEPVRAGPPGALYRAAKFLKRNRATVALATAGLLLLLLGLTGTATGMVHARAATGREREQRTMAEASLRQAVAALRALTDDTVERLIGGKPGLTGAERRVLDSMRQRWDTLADGLGETPAGRELRAEGAARVADLWKRLGQFPEAEAAYRRALALAEPLVAEQPRAVCRRTELARVCLGLGSLLHAAGQSAEAESLVRRALACREQLAKDDPLPQRQADLADACNGLCSMIGRDPQRAEEAEALARRALAVGEQLVHDHDAPEWRAALADAASTLGVFLHSQGRRADAEPPLRQALKLREQLLTEERSVAERRADMALACHHLGSLLGSADPPPPESLQLLRTALTLRERLAADEPGVPERRVDLAGSCQSLAIVQSAAGAKADAESLARRAVELRERLAEEQPQSLDVQLTLGHSLLTLGTLLAERDAAGSVPVLDRAVQTLAAVVGRSPDLASARSLLKLSQQRRADVLRALGRGGEAG